MKTKASHDDRMAALTFATVYPMYLAKVERKGRSKAELDAVIRWLTGLDDLALDRLRDEKATFATFFDVATLNPDASLITGTICGVRVEQITTPLTQKVRYLDKLVDELAKGWAMDRVLRRP
ncbi:DUF2200 domain-containing protein [Loktanella sp. DJP18]|uniref:DUF2200 domain-containing protein n=1 Tax=Loktanella sp. DJP18 TaxID=3409788 RepID=UPI003BB7FF45